MDNVITIPYFVHEGIVERLDRINRRLLCALAVAAAALIVETAMLVSEDDEETDA